MPIHLPEFKISLYTSPKVLSTSLKLWAFELENGRAFEPYTAQGRTVHIHRVYPTQNFSEAKHLSGFMRIAFVRDPVARFVSFYSNRILRQHNSGRTALQLEEAGLRSKPTLGQLTKEIEAYRSASGEIEHHSRPQVSFLGDESAFYDFVFSTNDVKKFQDLVKQVAGPIPEFPWEQKSGQVREQLGLQSIFTTSRIRRIYASDYRAFANFF